MSISKLPSSARVKLAALQQQTDELVAVFSRTTARANELEVLIGFSPESEDAPARRQELTRLRGTLAVLNERKRNAVDLVAHVGRFVGGIGMASVVAVKPMTIAAARDGKPIRSALEETRNAIGNLQTEIRRVAGAAVPLSDQKAAASEFVKRLAAAGAPTISATPGSFQVQRAADFATSMHDWMPFLCWLFPGQVTRALHTELDQRPEPALALSSSQKRRAPWRTRRRNTGPAIP